MTQYLIVKVDNKDFDPQEQTVLEALEIGAEVTPTSFTAYWPDIVEGWHGRAAHLGLKPGTKTYEKTAKNYVSGVIRALLAVGVMSPQQANVIFLLAASGRLTDSVLVPSFGQPKEA